MSTEDGVRTFGVEEELLVVDPESGAARAVAAAALRADDARGEPEPEEPSSGLEGELMQQQLETGTRPCTSAAELADELRAWRTRADAAARAVGARVGALPTSPLPARPELTDSPRYREIQERYGLTAAEQLACGMHVHVGVASDEEAIAVLDRIRVWTPVLVALTAGSPYWQGLDTGYASFRSQLWRRWPCAGPTDVFGSPAAYQAFVQGLIDSGTVLDRGMLYFDVRPSERYPTIEIRVADVCPDADLVVAVAALARALVDTAAEDWRAGEPAASTPAMLVQLGTWRAARSGLGGDLVDPRSRRSVPAADVVGRLLAHTGAALDRAGDRRRVETAVSAALVAGGSAQRQREVYAETGDLAAVVADVVERTHRTT